MFIYTRNRGIKRFVHHLAHICQCIHRHERVLASSDILKDRETRNTVIGELLYNVFPSLFN